MFDILDLDAARARGWDVIIAGSSFAAMFFLRGLPPELSVLVVEAGEILPHDAQLAGAPLPAQEFSQTNSSPLYKPWTAHRLFGGNSNCWWGQVPRFHPSDFRLFEDHGIGAPWPIGYDELAPFYGEVEEIMEVAGGAAPYPRAQPLPYPPHALSRSDAALVATRPDQWTPAPSARSNGGSRPGCCANGVCNLCPVDAKFTVQNAVGHFTRPDAYLLTGTEARQLQIEGGRVTGLWVGSGTREEMLRGDRVALGTNPINNAAIMLRSGLGLEAPALGRYLNEQVGLQLHYDIDHPGAFGGTSITSLGYAFYDGPHRSERAAVLIEGHNAPFLPRLEQGRWTHRLKVKLIAEDEPLPENRVALTQSGEAHILWRGHSEYARRGLDHVQAHLAGVLPFSLERRARREGHFTEHHILGAHRMGDDPGISVVNDRLECHTVAGLYALGAGAFPTSSPANPTLTLSALSLRAGRLVA